MSGVRTRVAGSQRAYDTYLGDAVLASSPRPVCLEPRCLVSTHVKSHPRRRYLWGTLAVAAVLLLTGRGAHAQFTPTGYQEYFVTGHEQHIYQMMLAVANDANCPGCAARVPAQAYTYFDNYDNGWSSFMNSVVGAVASADGQRIYYDQWEDGFDSGIDPALGNFTRAQTTTLVLGDGNDPNGGTNGRACEFTTDVRLYPCNGDPIHDDTIWQGTYLVFNSDQGTLRAVASITRAGTFATVTTTVPHGMQNSDTHRVRISGATTATFNGTFTATVTGASTFTYTGGANAGTGGTIWAAELRDPTIRPGRGPAPTDRQQVTRPVRPSPTTTFGTARFRYPARQRTYAMTAATAS